MIHSNYHEIRVLVREIAMLCLTMLTEAKELESELNTLKKSFSDDGIREIDRCMGEIFDTIDRYQGDMADLTKLLQHYADGLEATK